MTVFVTVTLTFDLWVNARRATAIEYMCTKFGVDSSSRFLFGVRTNIQTDRQTDATKRPNHAGGYAGVGKYIKLWQQIAKTSST